MKIVVNKSEIKSNPFPKLMISESGAIYLMTAQKGSCLVGSVISRSKDSGITQEIGEHSSLWSSNIMKDFEGSVTLSND